MKGIALVAVVLVACGTGCITMQSPMKSVYEQPMPKLDPGPAPLPVSPGSLFLDTGAADLASDFRARHVGDVLTVKIDESALGKSLADNKLDRTSAQDLGLTKLFGLETSLVGRKLLPHLDPTNPVNTGGTKSFQGSGETSREAKLTGTLAVRVLAVGSGGRLLIAGQKEIKVNKETQRLTLAGIVRTDDVAADNSITSAQVADLTLRYGGSGDIADTTKEPWFQRLMTKVWPF